MVIASVVGRNSYTKIAYHNSEVVPSIKYICDILKRKMTKPKKCEALYFAIKQIKTRILWIKQIYIYSVDKKMTLATFLAHIKC